MANANKIGERIAKQTACPDLSALLAKVKPSDLHSLLLALYKDRLLRTTAGDLRLADPVVEPSSLNSRILRGLENRAIDLAKAFEAINLSPVLPLGAVTSLTKLDQSNVLSTIRNYECASDPTIGMSLEAARRRKNQNDRRQPLRL